MMPNVLAYKYGNSFYINVKEHTDKNIYIKKYWGVTTFLNMRMLEWEQNGCISKK